MFGFARNFPRTAFPTTAVLTLAGALWAASPAASDMQAAAPPAARPSEAYFEPNVGQAGPAAVYVARLRDYDLLLTSGGAVIRLPGEKSAALLQMRFGQPQGPARLSAAGPARGRVHYLLGKQPSNWRFGVPRYRKVIYEELYENTDLVFYGNRDEIEFDWIVHPGGDPGRIRWTLEGATRIRVDGEGHLALDTPAGPFHLEKPFAYQQDGNRKQIVEARYVLEGGTVRFALGNYDPARTLVIDPLLVYATFAGGASADVASAIAVDAQGRAHFAGASRSLDFPVSAGAFAGGSCGGALTSVRCFDAVVGQLNSAGTAVNWAVYLGGSDNDLAAAVSLDAEGNLYVTGATHSPDFPATPGAAQTEPTSENGRNADGFVAKFNSQGSLVYATRLGGDGADMPAALAAGAGGEVFVAGHTDSRNFPVTAGAMQGVNRTAQGVRQTDVFVTRLNAAGSQLAYSTYLGGAADDRAGGIAVNARGEAFVTGSTGSADFPVTAGALQQTLVSGGSDAFAARLAADGQALLYSTFLGGSGDDSGGEAALAAGGELVLVGSTDSRDFPTTRGTVLSLWKRSNGFIARLDAEGSALVYSSYLTGTAGHLALDADGNAYVGGRVGLSSPIFGGSVLPACDGSVLRKLNPSATAFLYSGFHPGLGALAAGRGGAVFSAGTATNGALTVTPGAAQTQFGGQSDLYIAKLSVEAAADISVTCIEHGASFFPGEVAPGQIFSLFGSGLGPMEAAGLIVNAEGRVTTELAGARVLLDGIPAPLIYVHWNQINAVVPYALEGRASVEVRVERDGELSEPFTLPVARAHPGLFTLDSTGRGLGAILNQDGTINGPGNAAAAGSIVTFFGTGEGPTDPPGIDGLVQPEHIDLPKPQQSVEVLIGEAEAEILYAGAAPGLVSGVLQVNARIPAGTASGLAPVQVSIGGRRNRQTVFVQVE